MKFLRVLQDLPTNPWGHIQPCLLQTTIPAQLSFLSIKFRQFIAQPCPIFPSGHNSSSKIINQ